MSTLNEQLINAVTYHHVAGVRQVLKQGADPNHDSYAGKTAQQKDGQPYTPLRLVMFCISDCDLPDEGLRDFAEIARVLIEHGADPQPAMEFAEQRYGKYSPKKKSDLFMQVWDIVANAHESDSSIMQSETTSPSQKEQIVGHFEKFIRVSDELRSELLKRVSIVSFKKGELLIDANKVSTQSFYLLSGLTRTYSLKEGKPVIEYFSSANQWANSPRSWRTGKADIYYIDAIEDTTALRIHVGDMIFLFNQFPELDRYGRLSMLTLLDHLMDRITSFRFTSAREKYAHFRETYPDIYHRIPLGMVASYLGISQETLSRVRSTK